MSSTSSETQQVDENSAKGDERKTKELCGHEHNGLLCMRSKGHAHEHAAFTASDAVTWE